MVQSVTSHKPLSASIKTLFAQDKDERADGPTILELRHEAEKAIRNLPPITAPAGRLVHSLIRGVHGRRRSGPGDSFWQYRPFYPGDLHTDIDWRRSAKSDNLFVRQKEWESAQNVFLWCDASPSMQFSSHQSLHTKQEKAIMLGLAAAILLVEGGERTGVVLHSRIRRIDPELARSTLFISGAPDAAGSLADYQYHASGFLPKPFEVDELIREVRRLTGD